MSRFKTYVDAHVPRSVRLQDIADEVGISRPQLSRYLARGLEGVSTIRVMKIASALGCDVEDIVDVERSDGE